MVVTDLLILQSISHLLFHQKKIRNVQDKAYKKSTIISSRLHKVRYKISSLLDHYGGHVSNKRRNHLHNDEFTMCRDHKMIHSMAYMRNEIVIICSLEFLTVQSTQRYLMCQCIAWPRYTTIKESTCRGQIYTLEHIKGNIHMNNPKGKLKPTPRWLIKTHI